MLRIDGRQNDEKRVVKVTKDYLKNPDGSVLIEMGDTKIICSAIVEEKVPFFLKGSGTGWITAEYSMLPSSTEMRKQRESTRGKIEGRTQEIQRLIGRSLRAVVDLSKLGERTVWIDCDVIQADGGTRTASITGAFIALSMALEKVHSNGLIEKFPVNNFLSAISVGVVEGKEILDLCYKEDFDADVDMNIIMTGNNEIVEIQGTGEKTSFSRDSLNKLLDLGEKGNSELVEIQKEILGNIIIKINGEE